MLKQEKIEFLVSKFRKKLEEIAENIEEGSEDFYQEFEQAEELIFNSQQEVSSDILSAVLDTSSTKKTKSQKFVCKKCEGEIKLNNQVRRKCKTIFGSLSLRLPYYTCKQCKKSFFLKEDGNHLFYKKGFSPKLSQKISILAQESSFETASDILYKLFNVLVCPKSIENISEKIGSFFLKKEQEESQKSIKHLSKKKTCSSPPKRCYIEVDGSMLNTTVGWKENKLAILFDEKDIQKKGQGINERFSIKKKKLISSLGKGVSEFENRLKLYACSSKTILSKEIVLVYDGAVWIENMLTKLFPKGVHILDWFHVTEHLWDTAKKIFGEKPIKLKSWVESYKQLLWDGKVEEVLHKLLKESQEVENQTPLLELYTYFNSRKNRMRYKYFRKKRYYIGSGAIESANKYAIQSRLKKAGMKWSIDGANAIAYLRTTYLSGQWESLWREDRVA